ncbi:MAG: tetratricopeptide repeat protein [Pirellulales bacterium]|nr:tetratricopeptide repeat protein [Pirellulales bacterium]
MNPPRLQRASLLVDQRRYDLAEPELTAAMAEEPNNALAHALMAICLLARKEYERATEFAERSIHLRPDLSQGYSIAAIVWRSRNYFDKAEASIREAIAISPHDPDYHATLSGIKYHQRDWEAARRAAEAALALDPEHIGALNLRAESLRKLGRVQDARIELQNALRVDPDSADTHAALGWAHLQKGDRAAAVAHFREALRLEPDSEWARQGVLETLRSYNPLYRPLLKFFLWMQSLSGAAQWGVVIGLYFCYRFLWGLTREYPSWKPFIMPLIILYVAFAAATWIGKPLMNLALRLHPLGRLALAREERIAANWIGGFLTAGLAALAVNAFYPSFFEEAAIALLVMVIPLAAMFGVHEAKPRLAAVAYTLLIGACGALFVVGIALSPVAPQGQTDRSLMHALGNLGFAGLLLGAFLSPLACNLFNSINWKK